MTSPRRLEIPDTLGLWPSLVLFGMPALLLWLATRYVVPALVAQRWEPLAAWFAAGLIVFIPILMAALIGAVKAAPHLSLGAVLGHLRVRPMSSSDWRITGLALLAAFAMTGALQALNALVWPRLVPHPPFMTVTPLRADQLYLLALWVPFFAANIIGEELWWRGFILPRQERVFGSSTFLLQGCLHGAFHVSFGLGVMFLVWPVVFIIPWAVQRTANTTVGFVVHGVFNGAGFLAVTLGLVTV